MTDRDPLAPKGCLSLSIDMALLRSMSMSELRSLREAASTIDNILAALRCQPRFGDHPSLEPNKARSVLEDISGLIQGYEEAAVNVARAATPANRSEAIERSWLLLGYEADMADGLANFACMAAEAMRDQAQYD